MAVDEVTSVYVGGLPYEANEDLLRDAFQYYGTIVSVKVRPAPLLPPFLPFWLAPTLVLWRDCGGADGLLRWSEACGAR